ncbi:hypothetical protein ES708_24828 [subsurface metagenome]
MLDLRTLKRYSITIYRRVYYHLKINNLRISNSGITDKGIPFVRLKNGLIFHGYLPDRFQVLLYKFGVRRKTKKVLAKECIRVAYDIVFRYDSIEVRKKHLDIRKDDVVLELGAFTGYYAMKASQIVGNSGKVIAIEAIKENFEILKLNIEKNNL